MKLYIITICLFTNSIFAQDIVFNDKVQDNIMLYRIKYFIDVDTNFCIGDFQSEMQSYILKNDEEFDVVYLPYDSLEYPNKDIKLFIVLNNYYSKKKKNSDERKKVSFNHAPNLLHSLMRNILIGYNIKTGELIFISGHVFKNCIKNDFSISKDDPNTFFDFLRFKLFNYGITQINFYKYETDHLLFEAISKFSNETLLIRVSKYDYDDIQVKSKKSNWTERGAYQWK